MKRTDLYLDLNAADLVRPYIAGLNVAETLAAYTEAAYWASNSETDADGGGVLAAYMAEHDCTEDPAMLAEFRRDVVVFLLTAERAGLDLGDVDAEQAGHDIWLTRNGHGVGFWDRDDATYGTPEVREQLDEIAKAMGDTDLYVDVDNNTVRAGYSVLNWAIRQFAELRAPGPKLIIESTGEYWRAATAEEVGQAGGDGGLVMVGAILCRVRVVA